MIHFYLFQKENKIVLSDLPKEKVKSKYGQIFEIVNSVKDKEYLDVIKQRVSKSYPQCMLLEDFYVRRVFSEETRQKLREKKLGKPRPDWVRNKISSKMKGKSNFEGKAHREGSRRLTSDSMKGKQNAKDKKWIYNPEKDIEKRIDNVLEAPEGFRKGRDPTMVNRFIA